MFGQNDNDAADTHISNQTMDAAASAIAADASTSAPAVVTPTDQPDAPAQSTDESWQHPGTPLTDSASAAVETAPAIAPVVPATTTDSDDSSPATPVDTPVTTSAPAPIEPAAVNDLIDIKQQALTQLTPLVGHLDQTPEEKFRTTMMMIQASDDQSMIKTAYDAAQAITDEKVRAQALLDIVNEINYFTQNADK